MPPQPRSNGYWTGLDCITLGLAVNRIWDIMNNWILVALPMFIFMGVMLDKSNIAEKLMQSMQGLFGQVCGGLAITVTAIGIILAASTGIIGASVVLLAMTSLPAMRAQNYNQPFALGTAAAASTLGILIGTTCFSLVLRELGRGGGSINRVAAYRNAIRRLRHRLVHTCRNIHPWFFPRLD